MIKFEWKKFRNEEVINWINKNYPDETDRQVAFETYNFLMNLHPEINEILRGKEV